MSIVNQITGEYEPEKLIHVGSCRLHLDFPYTEIDYMSLEMEPGLLLTPEKLDVWIFYHALWSIFENPLDSRAEYLSQRIVETGKFHFDSKFNHISRVEKERIWINSGPLSMFLDEKKVLAGFQDMKAAIGQLPESIREKFLVMKEITN